MQPGNQEISSMLLRLAQEVVYMDINHKLITYVLLWWTLNHKVALCRITAELHREPFHEWTWPCKGIEQMSLFYGLFCRGLLNKLATVCLVYHHRPHKFRRLKG
ncbi:uncharacterized [Tachysurus ichikawai]